MVLMRVIKKNIKMWILINFNVCIAFILYSCKGFILYVALTHFHIKLAIKLAMSLIYDSNKNNTCEDT